MLFVESTEDLRFTYDDEDALVALGRRSAPRCRGLAESAASRDEAPGDAAGAAGPGGTGSAACAADATVAVRHFAADDSVFLGDDYLIKGVAGAILWKLVRDHVARGPQRVHEPRAAARPALRLPDVSDNLEARLILLERRLVERGAGLGSRRRGGAASASA